MTTQETQQKQSELKAGPLKSQLTLEIHTHFAIRLWKGRTPSGSANETAVKPDTTKSKRWMIPSVPLFLSRVSRISDDALKGLLFAEMALYRLEEVIDEGTQKVHEQLQFVDEILKTLPTQAVITDITSTSPINLEVFSRTPLGYKCVWLLVGVDQLALRVLQGYHYGVLSRQKRDKYLDDAGHQVRRVLGMAASYRQIPINRNNLDMKSEAYQQAIRYSGELDADIISGRKRSSFLPPLNV